MVKRELPPLGQNKSPCVYGRSKVQDGRRSGQQLPFRFFFGRAYDDKDMQERLIKDSALDWTIARPGVLTNGSRTGRYKVLKEPSQWRNGTISRADVASFLVQQIEDRAYLRKTPVLVY